MNQFQSCKGICIILILALLPIVSCGGKSSQKKGTPQTFTLPTVPAMISNPTDRANYLAAHWWDHYDFSDTALIHLPNVSEQAFYNYVEIFPHVSEQVLRASIQKTLEQALVEPKMFAYFTGLFENYLYDPNAYMRNEEYYRLVLEYIVDSPLVDEWDKVRPKFQLEQVNKNRPGDVATDFVYTLANGRSAAMHSIKSEFLILFFNNPGCTACGDYQQALEASPVVSRMLEIGKLKILAMYVDEDIRSWEEYVSHIPPSWINAHDASQQIRGNVLYDLRAIPNLYLVDSEKRVILKDVLPHQIEEHLLLYLQNML